MVLDISEDLEQLSQQLAHAMRMDSDMGVDANIVEGEQTESRWRCSKGKL